MRLPFLTRFRSRPERSRPRRVSGSFPALETLEPRALLALSAVSLPASDIGLRSATIGAEILDTGGTSKPDLAIYWGDDDAGTVPRNWDHSETIRGVSVGQYRTTLTGLNVHSTYYYRAFALNVLAGGAMWTDVASFTTLPPQVPTLTVSPPRWVTGSGATVSGEITDNGGEDAQLTVYWGTTDAGATPSGWDRELSLGTQASAFTQQLSGLAGKTHYIYRIAASNSGGTRWSDAQSFDTLNTAPLRINEFMAANGTTALSRVRKSPTDAFPKTLKSYDWIELQNSTDAAIDLSSYSLTDNRDIPWLWRFPAGTRIEPHSFLVVYASGEDVRDPQLDEQGRLHTNFQLSSDGEFVGLADADGNFVSSFAAVNQFRDVAFGYFGNAKGRLSLPTPGAENAPLGPSISNVTHEWIGGDVPSALRVRAQVDASYDALINVTLHYRAMFNPLAELTMLDDGQGADTVAGDGIFSADIPANIATPGQMVRYYLTATSSQGITQREPTFVSAVASPEFYGTIVPDPTLTSGLPVLHRFVENTRRADTGTGTRASVFYQGEFYDNVFIRIRGGTAREWPKKSYKLEFNDDHPFLMRPDVARVDEIDINATYTDKSYTRARLTAEFQDRAGTPSPVTYHIQMRQNGQFFSVALIVEQPDQDFLIRNHLDPEGSLYKANPGATYVKNSAGAFEKKTRDDEDKSDVTALLSGLQLKGADLERFLFDNIDLPAQINFIATNVITQNIDATDKNHFLYRDTNGSGEWQMMPWDLDLTYGPDALNTDLIIADQNTRGAVNPTAVHPFLGAVATPLHVGKINMLIDDIVTTPRTREMLLRRIRSLADEYLGAGYFHQRLGELVELLKDEVPLDRQAWGTKAHFGAAAPDFRIVVDKIKQEYLDRRYPYLTQYHVTGGVGIPAQQPAEVTLQFGAEIHVGSDIAAGDEYFWIENPAPNSVDVSNWRITGATDWTIKPGTVIGAGGRLYLTRNVRAFRARSEGPAGNQGLFVQGYDTDLAKRGGTLTLLDAHGRTVTTARYGESIAPADASNLRITEINVQPHDGLLAYGELPGGDEAYEFVELSNISDQPIELSGVQLTDGVEFTFQSQVLGARESIVVVGNTTAFVSRFGQQVPLAIGDDGNGGTAGEFGGKLNNAGETLQLIDAAGGIIQSLSYSTQDRVGALGNGSSLEWIPNTDPQQAGSWQVSGRLGGTPGSAYVHPMRDVVINEVRARSNANENDLIELYNNRADSIDLSGWYLTDQLTDLPRYQFPAGTTIGALQYLVLSETEWGSALNGSAGDHVWLLAPDDQGRPSRVADFVQFGPTALGQSIGRWPDGESALVPLEKNSFGAANHGPLAANAGDFNQDLRLDDADLALLCAAIRTNDPATGFDLNHDSLVSQADMTVLVRDVMKTYYGDVNFDGVFNSDDLVQLLQSGIYEDATDDNATWKSGDWDCDGDFTTLDLVLAFARSEYRG